MPSIPTDLLQLRPKDSGDVVGHQLMVVRHAVAMLPILGNYVSVEGGRKLPCNAQIQVIIAGRIDRCIESQDIIKHGTPIHDGCRTSNVISP